MWTELAADLVKMGFFVACGYAALSAYARRRRPDWTAHLSTRRLAVLGVLTLAVSAIKVIEDVVEQESGPVDTAVLWFVRDHVPAKLSGAFSLITHSGSATFLVPLGLFTTLVLLAAKRRFEALLLALSLTTATLLTYVLKVLVARERPVLWDTQWYWGSSFPSGHTLSTAAFSTAVALCVARIWPRWGNLAMALALLWTALVALSRLVLGVHWPSDVLAAFCLGAFIALLLSVMFDRHRSDAAA
ncbi:MAG: phosphatase PAP2 family protein [Rhodoferax sp.]|nr:phosphatase PAP2 family protein [Rhodoferax sp.]